MQDLCNTQDGAHCGNSNRFQSLSFVKGAPAQMPQGSYIHPKNIRSGEVLEQEVRLKRGDRTLEEDLKNLSPQPELGSKNVFWKKC